MRPIPFPEMDTVLAAPKDWDEATQGNCVGLPVRQIDDGCFSVWEPTPEERAIIAAGGNVTVHVFSGLTQPPIAIGVRASENPAPMSPAPPRPALRQTYTFVEMDVSQAAYDEIAGKLKEAGYDHAFGHGGVIDMHGIALTRIPVPPVVEADSETVTPGDITHPTSRHLFKVVMRVIGAENGEPIADALVKLTDLRNAADRWRALLGSPYISIMGWAGFDRDIKPIPAATYMHFGINFWSEHGYTADHVKEPTERGRRILTAYADARLAAKESAVGVASTTTGGE